MRIIWKARRYEIPIDLERGIRPRMVDDDEINEQEEHYMMQIVCTDKKAKTPERKSEQAAGLDLSTVKDIEIQPGESCVVGTGIAARIPAGHYGQIKPRSSLAAVGITVDAGVIDADYTGKIKIIIVNRHRFNIAKLYGGDRVAQLIIIPIWTGKVEEATELIKTDRGEKGFGFKGANIEKIETKIKHAPADANKKAYTFGKQLKGNEVRSLQEIIEEFRDIFATTHAEINLKP